MMRLPFEMCACTKEHPALGNGSGRNNSSFLDVPVDFKTDN